MDYCSNHRNPEAVPSQFKKALRQERRQKSERMKPTLWCLAKSGYFSWFLTNVLNMGMMEEQKPTEKGDKGTV